MHKFVVLPQNIIESRKSGTQLPVFHDIDTGEMYICAELSGPVTIRQAGNFQKAPFSTWFECEGTVRGLPNRPEPLGTPHIIHVNRSHISMNKRDGTEIPVFTVKTPGMKARYGTQVVIKGPATLIHSQNPLSCGARAWIETLAPLEITEEKRFTEVRSLTKHVYP